MSTLSFQDYVRERMLKRRRSEMAGQGAALPADDHDLPPVAAMIPPPAAPKVALRESAPKVALRESAPKAAVREAAPKPAPRRAVPEPAFHHDLADDHIETVHAPSPRAAPRHRRRPRPHRRAAGPARDAARTALGARPDRTTFR